MGRKRTPGGVGKRSRVTPGPKEAERRWQQALAAYDGGRYDDVRRALAPLVWIDGAPGEVPLLAGLAEARLGNLQRAEQLLDRGVRLKPERVEGWLGLGNVLVLLGRPVGAMSAFREALERDPRNVAALNNLGIACEDGSRPLDALDCYEHALAIDPDHDDALRGRANMLGQVRRIAEAVMAYEDLLRRHPDDPGIALSLAELLERANRPEEAARFMPARETVDDPDLVARSCGLEAQLMIRRGSFDAGLELLARARRETGRDSLSFREGGILDKLGRTDDAMRAFRRANAARAREGRFSRLRRSDLGNYLQDKLKAEFPAPSGVAAASAQVEQPVFLVGLPRSGTTLLDRMLAAHPRIQVFEEVEGVRVAEQMLVAGASNEDARAAYWRQIQRRVAVESDRVHVDKHPMNAMMLDVIGRLFPAVRVIFALRHPYDAALSCYMQDFVANQANVHFLDLESAAGLCARLLEMMRRFEEINPERVIRIRYEDLVTNHRSEIARVLQEIGLEWDEQIDSYATHAVRAGLIGTASYEQVTRELYSSAVDRWKRYAGWLDSFDHHLGPIATAFGYCTDRSAATDYGSQ